MPSPLKLFYMSVWRNLLTLTRYKVNFLFSFLTSAIFGVGMLVFSLVIDGSLIGEAIGSTNYVAFLVLGFSFQSWQGTALRSASTMFQGELGSGQIDYTLSCPFSRYWYMVTNIAALAVQDSLFFIPMFSVGVLLTQSTATASGIGLGVLATAVSVASLAQLGVIFGALVLKFRQVTAIFGFFNLAFQIFTGMLLPVQLLPEQVRPIGYGFPQTFGMDLLRHYVMKTNTIMPVEYEWASLFIQMAILAVIARLTVLYMERAAKEQGLHYI